MSALALTGAGNVEYGTTSAGATVVANKPANTADLDLLGGFVLFRNAAVTITPPSGWSLAGTLNTVDETFGFYTKPIPSAAAETATSYTWSATGGSGRNVVEVFRITGADLTTPVDVQGAQAVHTGTTSVVLTGLTPNYINDLLLAFAITNGGAGVNAIPAAPSGFTLIGTQTVAPSSTSTIMAAFKQLTTSAATGNQTSTISPAASNSGGFLLAIKSAVTNTPPTADAGSDQSVASGASVSLNGSGSSDSDGTVTGYAWTQISGTAVTLSSGSVMSPTFTAPTGPATIVLGLVVTDNNGATSSQDTVSITVNAAVPPTVVLDATTVDPGQTVTATVADSDGTVASVAVTGFSPAPTLSGSGGTRTFTAPPVEVDTVLTVTATDNVGASGSDTVTVRSSGIMVRPAGSWVPAYMVTGV